MKINFVSKPIRRIVLPILAATTISTNTIASSLSNKAVDTFKVSETTFNIADKNEDGQLNYDEFMSIGKPKDTQKLIIKKRPYERELSIGMGLLALVLAVADILNTARNKKRNS